MSKPKHTINTFGYMNMDLHEDFHDQNAVSFVVNGVRQNTTKKGFGYVNERGTKLCAKLPDGYKIRGYTHLAERDEFIVFLYDGTNSEIGGIGINSCHYKKYVNDSELPCKFEFGHDEWITIVPKRIQPCNEVMLYWSNKRVYKYFNIDDPHNIHLIKSCEDINLFKRNSAPNIDLRTVETGGAGILNGIYQVAIQLTDEDGNVTNWFHISEHAKIWGGNNKAGEVSDQYIEIDVSGFTANYKHLNVAIIKTIGDKVSAHLIYDKYPYVSGRTTLVYRAIEDELLDIPLEEIYNKADYWLFGKGLMQKDNRLVLYDLDNHINLDYQRKANEANVKYGVWRVRVEEAHKYPSMMGSETYLPGIRWNYVDGTTSPAFPYINKNVVTGTAKDDCSPCDLPIWENNDTSQITWEAEGYGDPFEEIKRTKKTYKNFRPKVDPYKTIKEWSQEHINEAESLVGEAHKDLEKSLDELSQIIENAENSSCCDAGTASTETQKSNEGCKGKVCPPGCICRNGCCYKIVVKDHPHPPKPGGEDPPTVPGEPKDVEFPLGWPEVFDGCGQIADYVPAVMYELCDSLPPVHIPGVVPGIAYASCSSLGVPCPGCPNCQPDFPTPEGPAPGGSSEANGGLDTRSGGGVFYVPPPQMGDRGLCNGGAIGNACGHGTDCDVEYEATESNVTYTPSLETRGDSCDADCMTGICPPGCECVEDPEYTARPCLGRCGPPDPSFPNPCGKYCDCEEDPWDGEWKCVPNNLPYRNCVPIKDPGGDDPPIEDPGGPGINPGTDDEPIYDEDGCTIIGYKPIKVLEGLFGYAESKETYPETKDCDGKYIYGDYAGKPITLFRAPSRMKVPHFMSYQDGVKSTIEPGNEELAKGYVQVIGIIVENILPPDNLPKPLDENNPFSIVWIPRDPSNKTVLGKALAMGTFEGEVYGETYLFPKNGVNSLEYFNRYIKSSTKSNNASSNRFEDHAGYNSEYAGYTLHSPDFTFKKSFVKGSKLRCELELSGKGYRHGLYATGDEPSTPELVKLGGIKNIITKGATLNVPRINQKGTRSSVHLNKFDTPIDHNGSWSERCIRDITYVNADSISKKTKLFDRAYCNRDSESCVFTQVDDFYYLKNAGDDYISDGKYNGDPEKDITANRTSDISLLGDVKYHNSIIYNAALHYVSVYRRNPRQYGRLEKARYVATGVEGTMDNYLMGKVEGIMGDVYVTPYTFTKSTYVSDRVGGNVLVNDPLEFTRLRSIVENGPETGGGKHGGKAKGAVAWIKRVALNMSGANLAWSMGLCGDAPVSGLAIGIDPRNQAGLRYFDNDLDGEKHGGFYDGETKFRGYSGTSEFRRGYYPGLQKTEIISWIESDIAVPLRELGREEEKEINYFDTKGYALDSSFSNNIGWRNKYMNKFYMELQEVSAYQKIFMTFIMLAFRVVFPLYIIVQLGRYVHGGGGIVGFVGGIVIQIILIIIVIIGIIFLFIALKTFASEYLLSFLGLKQCYNDYQGGPGDGLKRDFHDNFCRYNWDYSRQNIHNIAYGMPINYNVCPCVAEPSNKIIYSNPQMIDAPNDAWRNFKVNSILTLGTRYGKITLIESIGGRLFAFCTDMIYDLRSGDVNLATSEETVVLGRGDFINQAIPLWEGVPEGHAGLKYPNAAINTSLGLFFLDYEASKIYLFNGQLEEISTAGVSQFLLENSKFYTSGIVDQKTEDGVGYACGYDHKYERVLITKYDNEFSWTLSFDLRDKKWVSFHSYTPHLYMYDRFKIFSEKDGYTWQYGEGDKYQTFFGKYYPFVIEYPSKVDGIFAMQHDYTVLNTEANMYQHNPMIPIRDIEHTFNKGFFHNTNQSTGQLNLLHNIEDTDLLGNMKEYSTAIRITKMSRNWRISDLKDYTHNTMAPIYMLSPIYMHVPNPDNLRDEPKHLYLNDRFLTHQFTLDDTDSVELIAKGSISYFKEPEV